CTEGDYEGFNLIGNPFSSALNAEIDTWSKQDVGNAVWVWDGEAGNYKSWNGSVGNLENGIIPAMQGFFVQAMGPAPSLTIPTSSRIHDTQVFYKEEVQKILHITLFQGTLNDGVTLSINDSSFAGYDPFQDVLKFYGAPHAPQLFWIEEDSYLSINVCPPKVSGLILPLGFIACDNGLCRMQFSGQESFPDGEDLFLEDYQENQSINLRKEAEYKFQAEEGFNASRFAIRIGRPAGISGRLPHPLISISACQNRVILSGLEAIEGVISLKLYDLKGDLVQAEQVTETRQVIETNLPGGIYIVTLITPNDLFSKKIHLEPTSH
ncbi:MAG: T9SS type A sorting domain-containing protein, partial [Bacteroidales bacterium]|nr:T9SS type A sorting domain-containing protein [Bacteroidales bacterium]